MQEMSKCVVDRRHQLSKVNFTQWLLNYTDCLEGANLDHSLNQQVKRLSSCGLNYKLKCISTRDTLPDCFFGRTTGQQTDVFYKTACPVLH